VPGIPEDRFEVSTYSHSGIELLALDATPICSDACSQGACESASEGLDQNTPYFKENFRNGFENSQSGDIQKEE
jgi:hypothetical protein